MRSSKSRSRNKNNRNNRSVGNVLNRVFDSSGPEGKVRGTPQQIIDKYQQLQRDAQLSGDRVAAENFQQHAEHYARMLGEAQKEMDAKREQQERENREKQAQRDQERSERQDRDGGDDVADPMVDAGDDQPQPDMASNGDAELVETPEEAAPAKKPRKPYTRKAPAKKKPAEDTAEPVVDAE